MSDNTATPASPSRLGALLRHRQVGIFAGALLMIVAGYLLIVSLSYFANCTHDQSLVENRDIAYLTGTETKIGNSGGPFGAWIAQTLINGWMGIGMFIFIFYIASLSVACTRLRRIRFWSLTLRCLVSAITLSMVLGFITFELSSPIFWGGYHGHYINKLLIDTTGIWGALGLNILLVLLTLMLFYNDLTAAYRRWRAGYAKRKAQIDALRERRKARASADGRKGRSEAVPSRPDSSGEAPTSPADSTVATEPEIVETPVTATDRGEESSGSGGKPLRHDASDVEMTVTQTEAIEESKHISTEAYDPTKELSRYRKPSLDLLRKYENNKPSVDLKEQEENKASIIQALSQFGIGIARIEATVGPTVTLYEVIPAEGVRIAQIKRLEDDLARTLAAAGIRIIAPIPNKGTVGIEVPNKEPQIVPIRTILSSKPYVESKMELPMAMGSTISNEVFIADLTKMPHLLVAGATGMGKSVGLNTIIASLLYKKHPAELKLVLIDPKMVEFAQYACLQRHFLAKLQDEEDAIITDVLKVVPTLNSLCVEMDNRYQLLKDAGDRNIKDYNKRFRERRLNPEKGHRYMPYIVVIVDEFADLIMTAGKEVETPIARLAQKARAVGIHLILATQRPSTNVITGLIKANFPGRIAFRTTQMVDSRTIIDRPGANQLIGRGDMLFSQDGRLTRVQCALIETDEVEAICKSISDQIGYPEPYILPEYIPVADTGGAKGAGRGEAGLPFGDRDPLFEDCARKVVTSNLGSTSSLQRTMSIGYVRAGKIMDQMEALGIVGPAQGGKPRQVLVDIVTLEEMLATL